MGNRVLGISISVTVVVAFWFLSLSAFADGESRPEGKYTGTSIKFEYPPVDISKILFIEPMGSVMGDHVTPIDHQYYKAPDHCKQNNARIVIDVYSPADGVIREMQHMGSFRGDYDHPPMDDYRIVIQHTDTISSAFIHVDKLSERVAKAAPDELVEMSGGLVEAIGFDGCGHIIGKARHATSDPAVDGELAIGGIETGVGSAAVHLAIAGGIPQLGGEVAITLHPRGRELHVAALGGQSGQGKAQGVGAVLVDEFQGVNDIALGLGHFLALFVTHQGMDIDRVERRLAHEVEAHHHHPRHPEKDNVEARHQNIGGIIALKLGRLLRPS